MLPDERTTLTNTLALPSDVEALVAAPGRGVARPIVVFLRSQGISVQTAGDADSAFEEALLHPPDVVLIDDRIPPAGGVELCQRLKGNIRTHFVPTIVFALNDLRQFRLRAVAAGADAVFAPSTDAQERRTRLWSLLRSRALFRRMERKQRSQGSEIVERRRWVSHLLHDLQGSVATLKANVDFMSRFGPPLADPRRTDFDEAIDDARTVFDQLMQSVRTVMDFDRFETGQLILHETTIVLGDVVAEVVEELGRHAESVDKSLTFKRPTTGETPILGDYDLMKRVVSNLIMNAIKRGQPGRAIAVAVVQTDEGVRFSVTSPGELIAAADRPGIFEPYSQMGSSAVGYGLGLALARAVVEMHGGRIWVEDTPRSGVAFVLELRSDRQQGVPGKRRGSERTLSRQSPTGRGRE
jgi:signal transduction histidine kinase